MGSYANRLLERLPGKKGIEMMMKTILAIGLLIAAAVLVMGCGEAATPTPKPTATPTATPVPLRVEYVDAAGKAEQLGEMAELVCTETAERPASPHGCSAYRQAQSLYAGEANRCQAGSKVHWFKIDGRSWWTTIERARKIHSEYPKSLPEKDAWAQVLEIFRTKGLETKC